MPSIESPLLDDPMIPNTDSIDPNSGNPEETPPIQSTEEDIPGSTPTEPVMETSDPYVDEFLQDQALVTTMEKAGHSIDSFRSHTMAVSIIRDSELQKRQSGHTHGLFGEVMDSAETVHATGQRRRVDSGYLINLDYLRELGIDPNKVLVFRRTQPQGEMPKLELYWTTDFWETVRGLTQEIRGEQRQSSVVLVSTLEGISRNGGLILDINDDNGIPVKQRGNKTFDQTSKDVLTMIKDEELTPDPDDFF